jgi:hypothetical protein
LITQLKNEVKSIPNKEPKKAKLNEWGILNKNLLIKKRTKNPTAN